MDSLLPWATYLMHKHYISHAIYFSNHMHNWNRILVEVIGKNKLMEVGGKFSL